MFALGPTQRVAERPDRTGLTTSRSTTDAGDDVVREKCLRREKRNATLCGKFLSRCVAHCVRPPNRGPAVVPILAAAHTELIYEFRRECRDHRSRNNAWSATNRAVKTVRPIRHTGLRCFGPVSFPCSAE